jgi:anaplastic lymphoma kinase
LVRRWETTKFNLGRISQNFRIILEIAVPLANSSIGVDSIRLVNCFPESGTFVLGECTSSMFRCANGKCLKRDRVCDLTADCADGEDETYECGKST